MANSKRAGWSIPYTSDRPQDILGFTAEQEADFSNIFGLSGHNQTGAGKDTFILFYDGTSAPTLTDYASTPIGTVIIAPKLAVPKIYIHNKKSETPVAGDWFGITAVAET